MSCGVGMKKRARMMKMPASDGSECQADLMEVDKCMMPECSEYDQQISPTFMTNITNISSILCFSGFSGILVIFSQSQG